METKRVEESLSLAEIIRLLKDRKTAAVSAATGLHENTVRSIAGGENQNPTRETLLRLTEYLRETTLKEG